MALRKGAGYGKYQSQSDYYSCGTLKLLLMMRFRIFNILSIILSLLCSVGFMTSCEKKSMEGKVIITLTGSNSVNADYITGESRPYTEQSQILAVDPLDPDRKPEPLTADFYSACSPDISYNGKCMLFTGEQKKGDAWQIWEMNLENFKIKQVTSSPDNSIDPAYLPGGRIVFSRYLKNDSLKAGHTLFTCNLDGNGLKRITFNPHEYFAPSVLRDGRVIVISRQIFPDRGRSSMMVLRPDGTKSELFYQPAGGHELISRGYETKDGHLIFIESSDGQPGSGGLVSVRYNRPLHSRTDMASEADGDFHSVTPLPSGKLLVSYRPADGEKYALYEFDPENKIPGDILYKSTEFDVTEGVMVAEHERPKKLPSEVDTGVKTGLLLCQNVNITGMQSPETINSLSTAEKVEIMGIDSSLGVVDVEKDGSLYLKISADMPFRIITMDKGNTVLNGPGAWLWLRPNERRGCVGCHEDNEMVPANRYALAVSKNPKLVPVHISGVKEKDVELE
jgi:hypothetical protein